MKARIVSSGVRRPARTSRVPNRLPSGSHSWPTIAWRIRLASAWWRGGVVADQRGDLGQRLGRPAPDRVEQRPLDQERAGGQQRGVVVSGVAVACRQVDEAVVGGVGGPVGRVGVGEVTPLVGRQRARRDLQAGQGPVPGRRVVQARLPGMDERRPARAGPGPASAGGRRAGRPAWGTAAPGRPGPAAGRRRPVNGHVGDVVEPGNQKYPPRHTFVRYVCTSAGRVVESASSVTGPSRNIGGTPMPIRW